MHVTTPGCGLFLEEVVMPISQYCVYLVMSLCYPSMHDMNAVTVVAAALFIGAATGLTCDCLDGM